MDPIRPSRGRARGRPPVPVQSVPSQGVQPGFPSQSMAPSMPSPTQPIQQPPRAVTRQTRPMAPRASTARTPRPMLARPRGGGDSASAFGPGSMQEVNNKFY